ncbi:rhodanese-like domain-containing protein [Saliterribacillus persicus]|uniref:Rhodanese-related sulfurtransferase n=1 Tax=Saliterribacillus persicus TaxID=930114 RepID=A0A368XVG6_9BACI|nr:rhodanese-like domain-containing protein [Saliterribacillus persicus]RCW71981.1 rhodanese-related sulfurtransferase [Saliterribacillus persicus]
MGWLEILLFAVLIFFIVKRFIPVKGVEHISTAQLKTMIKDKNKQFVDVRTPAEYQRNHIKEFKNIPLHELGQKATQHLSKDKEVVVICQSGMRSQKAASVLKKQGFTQVTNTKGGMSAWS